MLLKHGFGRESVKELFTEPEASLLTGSCLGFLSSSQLRGLVPE